MIKIKEIRERQGLTGPQLAVLLDTDPKTIWRWENEKNAITSDKLVLIADGLCCTTDELLGRENYGTGNIEIIGEKVNNDEKDILAVYRALNADGKSAFLSMVKNLATLNNIAVKIS